MPYDLIGADELIGDDLIGGYDIIGQDDDDYIGARFPIRRQTRAPRRAPNTVYNRALAAATAMKQAQDGLIVRQQAPTKARRLVIGLTSSAAVVAGALATITARPQSIAFKPQRVVIPSTIAPDFIISDIKVGNKSQLVQSGELPGEAFSPDLVDGEMEMDTVQTSQDFVMVVQNISGASRVFRAAVYGRAADY